MKKHVPNCDKEFCLVCDDYLRELQEAIRNLYLHVRLHELEDSGENQTIDEYV